MIDTFEMCNVRLRTTRTTVLLIQNPSSLCLDSGITIDANIGGAFNLAAAVRRRVQLDARCSRVGALVWSWSMAIQDFLLRISSLAIARLPHTHPLFHTRFDDA